MTDKTDVSQMRITNKFNELYLYVDDVIVPPGIFKDFPIPDVGQGYTITIGIKSDSGWIPWQTSSLKTPYITAIIPSTKVELAETVNPAVCELSARDDNGKRMIKFKKQQLDNFKIIVTLMPRSASPISPIIHVWPEVGSTVTIGEEPPG